MKRSTGLQARETDFEVTEFGLVRDAGRLQHEGAVVHPTQTGYLVPVMVFAASRLILLTLAWLAPRLLPGARHSPVFLPHTDPLAALWNWTSPWFRFDSRWYVGVAEHGYHWGALGQANTNFMPFYPLLIKALQTLTLGSAWLAAWLIANLAFLAALVLLWRWACGRWEQNVAVRALVLVVAFPFSFFYAAPYAEPLFLALAIAAFLWAEQDRWLLATCAAGLCTITRPVGLAVVLGLVALALSRGQKRQAVLASSALIPLLGFVVYLTLAFGRPFAFLTYHSAGWVPPHGGVLTTVASQFHTHLAPFDRIDAAMAVLFVGSAILAWRRLGPAYGVYVAVGVLLPLAHGLVSMERYVIVLFPAMAAWATWENKLVQGLLFGGSVMALVLFSTMFASGYGLY